MRHPYSLQKYQLKLYFVVFVHHFLCFLQSIRSSSHIHKACLVRKPIHKCRDEYFVFDNLVPSVKCKVCGNEGGFLSRPEREMVEEHLPTFLVATDISELVANDHVIFLEPELQGPERLVRPCFPDLREQHGHGSEQHGKSLFARPDAQRYGQMCLPCSGVSVENHVPSLPDKLQCFQFRQHVPRIFRQFLPLDLMQVFHLRERGRLDACPFPVFLPAQAFPFQEFHHQSYVSCAASHCYGKRVFQFIPEGEQFQFRRVFTYGFQF